MASTEQSSRGFSQHRQTKKKDVNIAKEEIAIIYI